MAVKQRYVKRFVGRDTLNGRDRLCHVGIKAAGETDGRYIVVTAWCNTGGAFFDMPKLTNASLIEADVVFTQEVEHFVALGYCEIDRAPELSRLSERRIGRHSMGRLMSEPDWGLIPVSGFPINVLRQNGVLACTTRFGAPMVDVESETSLAQALACVTGCLRLEGEVRGADFIVTDLLQVGDQILTNLPYNDRLAAARALGLMVVTPYWCSDKKKVLQTGQMLSKGRWLVRHENHRPYGYDTDGDYWIDVSHTLHAIVESLQGDKCVLSVLDDELGKRHYFDADCSMIRLKKGEVVRAGYRWNSGNVEIVGALEPADITWRECTWAAIQGSNIWPPQSLGDITSK